MCSQTTRMHERLCGCCVRARVLYLQSLSTVNTLELHLRTDALNVYDVAPVVSVAIGAWESEPTVVTITSAHTAPGAIVQSIWTRVRVPLSSFGLAATGTVSVRLSLYWSAMCRLCGGIQHRHVAVTGRREALYLHNLRCPVLDICCSLTTSLSAPQCPQVTDIHVVVDTQWVTLYIDNVSLLKL